MFIQKSILKDKFTIDKISVVVTSISKPNKALKKIAYGCVKYDYNFIVIGDVTSPNNFNIKGCNFYNVDQQVRTKFKFAKACPVRHYARKNIGYLLAIERGSNVIIDTDDDNLPYNSFWELHSRIQQAPVIIKQGWVNIYRYFSEYKIWPRGLPLNNINNDITPFEKLQTRIIDCPIQQGLADNDPDVDAIYRLIFPEITHFEKDRKIALSKRVLCPFNSQNTTWWEDAFPLLYLPSFCSFRMTDVWRSFIAQRISWENDWHLLFHGPTVWQERNIHNLMKDFNDELKGYLYNEKIFNELNKLSLKRGNENIYYNLKICYEKLVEIEVIDYQEIDLLDKWIFDIKNIIKK